MKKPPTQRRQTPRVPTPPPKEETRAERFTREWLNPYRQDKAQALQTLTASFDKECKNACRRLVELGYQIEVDEFSQLVSVGQKSKQHAKEILLRGHSLRARCRYLDEGEATLFSTLPGLFLLDTDFYLQEPWIREVFVQWQRRGEVGKITRAFSGTREGKRGIRSYPLMIENRHRDEKIVAAMKAAIERGCGYREATRQVAKDLRSLDINEQLSPGNIGKIYKAWTEVGGIPAFVRFLAAL